MRDILQGLGSLNTRKHLFLGSIGVEWERKNQLNKGPDLLCDLFRGRDDLPRANGGFGEPDSEVDYVPFPLESVYFQK
jgi:hypothetical protein